MLTGSAESHSSCSGTLCSSIKTARRMCINLARSANQEAGKTCNRVDPAMAGIAHLPGDCRATDRMRSDFLRQFLRVTGVPGRCQGFQSALLLDRQRQLFDECMERFPRDGMATRQCLQLLVRAFNAT